MSDFLTQAESLFHQVRTLDRNAQVQRLEQIGSQEPALRATVEALLQADSTPDERLDRPIRDVLFGEIRTSDRLMLSETEARVRQIATPRRPSERYHDRREIGRGGMGTVYRIRDATLDRDLAMKVIGGVGESPAQSDQVLRFLREARVLARLDHPGIVPIHDLGVDEDGRPFFTMKLVQGDGALGDQLGERRTLEDVLDLNKAGAVGWSLTRVLELLLRVCDALAYAHARGVRHRDLKPSNVMVGRFGEVYVMDWGLAQIQADPTPVARTSAPLGEQAPAPRPFGNGASDLTVTGDLLGTPEYMAPEQAQGGEIDQRADIYSLGAILYRALTGVPPYQDGTAPKKRRASHQVLARLCEGPPRTVMSLAPNASAELMAICEHAMERERERRYADVEALAGDLRALLEGRVVHAYETGAWAEARKWVLRNRALAATAASLLVIALASAVGISVVEARGRKRAELERHAADQATEFLSSLFGQADPNVVGTAMASAFDVLEAGRDRAHSGAITDDRVRARVLFGLGKAYRGQGKYAIAEELLIMSLQSSRRSDATDTFWIAKVLNELGIVEAALGHYDGAIEHLELAVSLSAADPLPTEFDRAAVLVNLGDAHGEKGDPHSAMEDYAQAEQILSARNALDTPIAAAMLNGSANTLRRLGRLREAITRHERLIERLDRLGAPPKFQARTLSNLAVAQGEALDFDAARRSAEAALAVLEQIAPPDHPDYLSALSVLALIEIRAGLYVEAREKLERVLDGCRTSLDPDARLTLQAEHNMAALLVEIKQYEEADPLLTHALDAQRRVLGAADIDTLGSIVTSGSLREGQGRLAEAREAYLSVLDEFDRAKFAHLGRRIALLDDLVRVELALDLRDDARAHAQRLLGLAPQDMPQRAHALEALERIDAK